MLLLKIILSLSFTLLQASKTYPHISISSLSQDEGITIASSSSPSLLGVSVKNAGDFNNDGFQDVIIGSPGASGGLGAVYVIFGSNTSLSDLIVNSGLSSSQGMKIQASTVESLGYSVSFAGDVNNDGIDDIIIGGSDYSTYKGIAYVIYGSKTPPAILDVGSGLASSQGFRIIGASNYNYLGISVSYAGDVNKDGIDDIIIGAIGASASRGAAYVIFGQAGTARSTINIASGLSVTDGFMILGPSTSSNLGYSASNAGDIDGDGIDDIIVGAYGKDAAYVIYGKDTSISGSFSTIDLSSALSASQGFTITGAVTGGRFGISVSKVGDFNEDGRADVIIGAAGEDAAYVIFGNERSALSDLTLSSGIDSTRGIKIKGIQTGSDFGGAVSGAGDINGDDIDDIIIGAPKAASIGKAFVIFGSKNIASEIDLNNGLDDNKKSYGIVAESSGDYLGVSVSHAGDVNGDGLGDLIVGAYGVSNNAGAAYLLFTPFVCPIKCLTCESFSVCLTCDTGYGLEDGQCIECPDSTKLVDGLCVPLSETPETPVTSPLEQASEVSKGLFDSGSTASRIFTMGRSLSVGLGLIAKIIQNVRFLDIAYPEETLEAFKTYGTDLFELPIPQTLYESPETKELPFQYTRYDMEPSFLENYWGTIMMMLISLWCFLVIKFVQFLTKSQRKDHIFQVALKNVGQTFANFFVIQIYSNLDDVIFYLFLDVQSTKLNSPSSGISLAVAIFFLLLGLFLVFFHCWLLSKYQQAKSQGTFERFENRYKILGTLYEDFKDDSIAKQSFFGILIFRCVILILVITLLQPQWMQGALLMLTNLIFLAYFIYYRPFKNRFDEVVQYFCELTVFAAYLCVLILSIMDAQSIEKSSLRNGLGKCIVIAGIVLALGGFIVQVIQLIGAVMGIWKFLRNYNKRKNLKVSIMPILDRSQNHNTEIASESSIILKHSHLDQLGLIRTLPLKKLTQSSSRKKLQFQASNNLEVSSFIHQDHNITTELSRGAGPQTLKQNCEDSDRDLEGPKNQGVPRRFANQKSYQRSQIPRKQRQEREQFGLNIGPCSEESTVAVGHNLRSEFSMQESRNLRRRKRIQRDTKERRNMNFSGYNEDIN